MLTVNDQMSEFGAGHLTLIVVFTEKLLSNSRRFPCEQMHMHTSVRGFIHPYRFSDEIGNKKTNI